MIMEEKGSQSTSRGHRRSYSMPPIAPSSVTLTTDSGNNGDEEEGGQHGTSRSQEKKYMDLNSLVHAFTQISESLVRPARILNTLVKSKENDVNENNDVSSVIDSLKMASKLINIVTGNFDHILPHMHGVLDDYKVVTERSQSREEMLKTLDKALRQSEARNRTLFGKLQDLHDENKCLKEKARQNESILRYLENGEEVAGKSGCGKGSDGVDKGLTNVDKRSKRAMKSQSVGDITSIMETNLVMGHKATDNSSSEVEAKFGHYQKVLRDNEKQLQDLMTLNKELVLEINSKESEVMSLNQDLLKFEETLGVYETNFASLTRKNNEMDSQLREEKKKCSQLSERLEDSESYVNCITDKIASYEVELKYLRQELKVYGSSRT